VDGVAAGDTTAETPRLGPNRLTSASKAAAGTGIP
jgi:hypothetical protein